MVSGSKKRNRNKKKNGRGNSSGSPNVYSSSPRSNSVTTSTSSLVVVSSTIGSIEDSGSKTLQKDKKAVVETVDEDIVTGKDQDKLESTGKGTHLSIKDSMDITDTRSEKSAITSATNKSIVSDVSQISSTTTTSGHDKNASDTFHLMAANSKPADSSLENAGSSSIDPIVQEVDTNVSESLFKSDKPVLGSVGKTPQVETVKSSNSSATAEIVQSSIDPYKNSNMDLKKEEKKEKESFPNFEAPIEVVEPDDSLKKSGNVESKESVDGISQLNTNPFRKSNQSSGLYEGNDKGNLETGPTTTSSVITLTPKSDKRKSITASLPIDEPSVGKNTIINKIAETTTASTPLVVNSAISSGVGQQKETAGFPVSGSTTAESRSVTENSTLNKASEEDSTLNPSLSSLNNSDKISKINPEAQSLPRIAIIYHPLYPQLRELAVSAQLTIQSLGGTADLYQIPLVIEPSSGTSSASKDPIILPTKLPSYDAFLFGIPSKFSNFPFDWKSFWDSTGALWANGLLAGKYAAMFVASEMQGAGQETTIVNALSVITHHGMVYVPLGYKYADIGKIDEVMGGSPWGAGTFVGIKGDRKPSKTEIKVMESQAKTFFETVKNAF